MAVTTSFIRRLPWRGIRAVTAFLLVFSALGPAVIVPNTALAANEAATIDQWGNLPPIGWQNGNLNEQNSRYRENDSVPFRAILTNITVGSGITHTLDIQYDNSKASSNLTKHAYDYLTSYDRTVHDASPCIGIWATCPPSTIFPIPLEPGLAADTEPLHATQLPGNFTIYNGTITKAEYIAYPTYPLVGDTVTTVRLTFTVTDPTAVIAWGGHIASQLDWGVGNSANGISGSPYHERLLLLDGATLGNQDRSLKAAAVLPIPTMTTQVSAATIELGQPVTDAATFSGANGPVTGTADFYVCGPGVSAAECNPPNGTKVGNSIPIVSGTPSTATSDAFTPTAVGYWCFRVVYTPADGALYSPGYHTNATTECVNVLPNPFLTITKTADATSVSAGDNIGFTITVNNTGAGIAKAVTLSDALPTGAGIVWAISPAVSGCSITGNTLTCTIGDMASGASFSVHVTSPTTSASCKAYPNTATAQATNNAAVQASATTTVLCPSLAVTKTANPVGPVSAGDNIGFDITVTNNGSGTAKGVVLTDTLPSGTGIAWSVDPAKAGCSIASGVLTCTIGDMASGGTFSVHVTSPTTYASCGTLNNIATATPTNGSSASGQASVTVNCPAIAVTKTADAGSVSAGDNIGFTITVNNSGTGIARNVVLTDNLPTGTGISWSVNPAVIGCSITNDVLTCNFGDIAAGGSKSVHVTSPTTKDSCGTYNNTATATPSNAPPVTSVEATITVNCAAIQITKTADASMVSAGDQIGFTITVTNNGGGDAYDVTVIDTLPTTPGLDWTIDTAGSDTGCSIASGVLTCNWGTLAPDASKHVHITSPTTAATCGTVPNEATVSTSNDGEATANGAVEVQCPNVTVLKTADNSPINAGDPAAFTIVVSNIGPGVARNVTLSDSLPEGVAWSEDSASCDITGTLLSCNFGDMEPGGSATIHVSGATGADNCGTLTNTATAEATNEADLHGNSSTASIIVNCSDVSVTKVADSSPINSGDTAGFTVTVHNNGPGTAYNVTLTDNLPDGITWSLTPDVTGCSITGQTLSCSWATLAASANVAIHVSGTAPPHLCVPIENTVTVAADNEDNIGNNEANASITVNCPSLTVTKTPDTDTVSAGDPIGFTITVTSEGPGTAYGVTLNDTLPVNAGLAWTIDGGTGESHCSISAGVLSCDFGDMPSGTTYTVHITSPTTGPTCESGTVNNTASASSTNGASGEGSASVNVLCASIHILKTAATSSVSAGDPISFNILVTNTGQGDAHDVMVTDTLPANPGLLWTVTPGAPTCAITDGVLTCNLGTIPAGGSATITLSSPTTADTCGTVDNTASVSTSNDGSESSSASITVNCPALTVTKTADLGTVNAGDNIGFTITVNNAGPGIARGVTLNDTLPSGTGIAWSVGPVVSGCDIVDGALTCAFGDIAAGGSASVHVTSPTAAASCGTYDNTATATPTNGDLASGDASITVNCAVIEISKVADAAVVNAGENIGFMITVHNSGSGAAYNVVMTDQLPANGGLSWSIDGGTGQGSCSIAGGVLTCDFDTMASGASLDVHIISPTTAATCGTVNNTAHVTTTNDGEATANASVDVRCPNLTVEKTADTGVINAGDPAAFTIMMTNNGTGTAYNATFNDTLPAGVDWAIDPAVPGCSITGGVLACSFASLAPAASVEIHVSGQTDAADCGVLDNTVTVAASNENEADTGDNTSSASITVNCSDVTVLKTADNGTISAGDVAAFTITVSNSGAGTAYNVTLNDSLPPGVQWTINPAVPGCSIDPATNVLSCSFAALPSNASVEIHVSGVTDAAECGTLNNTATVAASNEANTTNNSSTAAITVDCPNLVVTKTANPPGPVSAGDPIGFDITVQNTGAGIARNVTLTDNLPTGGGLNWTVTGDGACSISGNTLTCNFGDIGPGGSKLVHLSSPTDKENCGTISNTATATPTNGLAAISNEASVTVNCANINITKTADAASVSAGDPIGFTITVTNNGAGTASDVHVTDTLPTNPGLNWTISPAVQECSISGGVLTCDWPSLAAGASVSVHITSPTTGDTCGTVSNTAYVTTGNDGSGQATGNITVQCGSLAITKIADAHTVSAGDPIGFTITVHNTGAGNLYGVILTDVLPTNGGLNWAIDGGTGAGSCSIASGTLACNFGTMAPGAMFTVHISSPTTAGTCGGTVDNTAEVTSINDGSASSSDSVTVECPDLTVAKTADNSPISAGDLASFTIVVTNNGQGVAKNVTLTDNLPAGVAWSVDTAECSIDSSGVLTCSFGDLAPGASKTIHVSGNTNPAVCVTLHNVATVAATNEANTENNSDDADIVVDCPDITVQKTTDTPSVNANDQIHFTIEVTNLGPGTAKGVTLSDPLPGGVTWTISGGTGASFCSITNGTLTCNFGDMLANSSYTVQVSGIAPPAVCGTLPNTVTVASTNEANAENNTDTATITVNCPDVYVLKSATNTPINAGDTAEFVITIGNNGPGLAKDVVLTDQLPAGITWFVDNALCSIAGGVLTCTIPTLAAGSPVTVHVTGQTSPDNCGTVPNTATAVSSNEAAGATGNNSGSASIEVLCSDVTIEKIADASPVSAGDQIGFVIEVTNTGTGSAYGVTVNDPLPAGAGLTWSIDSANSDAGCSIDSGVLTCDWGTLAGGASKHVHITSPTTAETCGSVDNFASVTTTNDGSAEAAASITVNCPDVKVTKTGNGTISAGDTAIFTIVVENTGFGTARNVTLTDNLPTGIDWSEDSADCTITGGVLSCNFGDLPAAAIRTVHVSGTTDAADCGTLTNTVTIAASNEASGVLANNTDTGTIDVQCAEITIDKVANPAGPVDAGDPIGFDIVVTNNGAGTAYGVHVTDTLPANSGLSWTISPAVTGCSISGGVLECNWTSLASQASVTVHITSPTTPQVCGTVSNTASVTTTNNGFATDDASVTVNCGDVTVAKTADNGTINAGDTASFKIVVSNIGQGSVYNVTVNDTLPAGVTWSVDNASCSITSGVLSCSLGTLAANASVEIHVSGTTTAANCGTLTNTATVSATNDIDTTNNSSTANITVQCPDVKVTKTADASPINSGDVAAFTIKVENIGQGSAYDVSLTDNLPANLTWTIDPPVNGCSITNGVLSCSLGTLAANASVTIHVSAPTTMANCGTLNNTASATASNEASGATGNNSSSASITVRCPVQGQVYETGTTCQQYLDGTGVLLSDIYYGVKSGKINNTAPGVFFYYTYVVAPGASFTVNVNESKINDTTGMPLFDIQKSQVTLYDAGCTISRLARVTVNNGQATLSISGATPNATYYIGVKYDTGSVVGKQVSQPYPTVLYHFTTSVNGAEVDYNHNGLYLRPKP